jgi:hypothetical protein
MGNGERNRQVPQPACCPRPLHEQHPGSRPRWTRLPPQLGRLTLYAGAESAVPASSPFRFLLVRTRTGPLLSQFVSTVAVHGSISPTLRGIDGVVGRYEQSNGCSVKSAENFSWSGMSSAVRRLTQGASAPNPHTPAIKCTSGHHDHFTCFLCPHRRFLDRSAPDRTQ